MGRRGTLCYPWAGAGHISMPWQGTAGGSFALWLSSHLKPQLPNSLKPPARPAPQGSRPLLPFPPPHPLSLGPQSLPLFSKASPDLPPLPPQPPNETLLGARTRCRTPAPWACSSTRRAPGGLGAASNTAGGKRALLPAGNQCPVESCR